MSSSAVPGQPAVPPTGLPPMGWYPDPTNSAEERYWDGTKWTHNTREPVEEPDWRSGLGNRAAEAPHEVVEAAPVPTARQWDHRTMQWQELPVIDPVKRTDDGVPLAAWGWRALGRIIDALLIAVVVVGVCLSQLRTVWREIAAWWGPAQEAAMRGQPYDVATLSNATSGPMLVVALVFTIITCTSAAFFHHRFGATPGQLAIGLRVVPLGHGQHTGGLPLLTSIRRAAGYALVLGLSQLAFVALLLDSLWPLFSRTGQTLHDRLGRTQVVRRPRATRS